MMTHPAKPMELRISMLENMELNGTAEAFMSEPQVRVYNEEIKANIMAVKRQAKLGPIEEVRDKCEEYFELCSSTAQTPQIKGLALYLGVTYQTLKKIMDDPTSKYYDVLNLARDYCHMALENGAINNKVNPATFMFLSANYYGMKNTQSVEIGRSSAERDLADARGSIDALKELLKREKEGTVSDGASDAEFVEK